MADNTTVRNPRTGKPEETDYVKRQKGAQESEINPGGLGAAAAAAAKKRKEKAEAEAQKEALKADEKPAEKPKK